MNGRKRFDELLHAHLDGDATRDGELLDIIAKNRDLHREFSAAGEAAEGLRALPATEPPPGFTDRVMARIEARPRSAWDRLSDLWALPALRYAAAAAIVVTVLAAGFLLGRSTRPEAPQVARKDTGASTVRFVYFSPAATRVHVVGDFNRWQKDGTPLTRSGDGRWTVEIELKPGRYNYLFYVDDRQWAIDPAAALVEDDDFGKKNSVLEI